MVDPEDEPVSDEPESISDSHWPDGLDQEWWGRFVQYRARKVWEESGKDTRLLLLCFPLILIWALPVDPDPL